MKKLSEKEALLRLRRRGGGSEGMRRKGGVFGRAVEGGGAPARP